ncbi:MAG: tellurium resistance protein TerC [Roseovarius sp.]|nr:tellurium resistance protein TerC [Roseovarius sp.]
MADLLTFENLGSLLMLYFLQAVLGFDNLLYISIESQRAPVAHQKAVRFLGIIIAVTLRVVLLFVMIRLIDAMAEPFFVFTWVGILEGGINFATCVFILGGVFIIYTAVKEIGHMISIGHLETDMGNTSGKSAARVVVLLGESGQAAAHAMHDDTLALRFLGYEVVPMSKSTFYFSVVVLFLVKIIQSGYTRKLNAERRATAQH